MAVPSDTLRRVRQWAYYGESYLFVASQLNDTQLSEDRRTRMLSPLPQVQLNGQALEYCLKGFIVGSTGSEPWTRSAAGHDLVQLAEVAQDSGADLKEHELISIRLLNSMYFRNDDYGWPYPARYPMDEDQPYGSGLPDFRWIQKTARALIEKAASNASEGG